MNRRSQLKRMALLRGFLVVALGLMVLRLVDLQIVNGATYREKAQRKILRTYDQPASRGEILDCYGRWYPIPWAFPSPSITIPGKKKNRTR